MTTEKKQDSCCKKEACKCGCKGTSICKRIVKWTLIVLVCLFLVLPLVLSFTLSPAIKIAVEKGGSMVTGCPVTVESINLSLLRGSVCIKKLVVGNPEGFKTASAMSVDEIYVKVDAFSLFTDTVVVDTINIDVPQITYEIGWGKTNIGVLLDNLKGEPKDEAEQPTDEEPESEAEAEGNGKKVCIRHVSVTGGRINLATSLPVPTLPLPLPSVTIDNIGGDPNEEETPKGATPAEATKEIFTSIFEATGNAASKGWDSTKDAAGKAGDKVGEAAGKAADKVGEAAGKAADKVGEAAGKAADKFKGLFK